MGVPTAISQTHINRVTVGDKGTGALLQPTKGAIVGLQWQTCMHDFEVTRRMRSCVEAVNHGEEMDLRHRNPSPLKG